MFFIYNLQTTIELGLLTSLGGYEEIIYMIMEIAVTSILAANVLFLAVDAKISVNLFEEAIIEAKQQTLTIDKFNLIRQEVDRRVNASFWMNACLVVIAICNTLAFNVLLYSLPPSSNELAYKSTIYELFLFAKEFLFLIIVFYVTAQVNEKADELTSYLAKNMWTCVEDKTVDHMRLVIYVAALDSPITFPLAGYRYKRIDIVIQLGTIVISSLIPIIQHLVGESNSDISAS